MNEAAQQIRTFGHHNGLKQSVFLDDRALVATSPDILWRGFEKWQSMDHTFRTS